MGLLRDTYNITKIDMSGIEYQMKRKNDIQEQQNFVINDTKNRVDISLREYEDLKKELKAKTELLKKYDDFISNLAQNIQQSPEILLKGKVVKSSLERVSYKRNYNLYVVWEFDDIEGE